LDIAASGSAENSATYSAGWIPYSITLFDHLGYEIQARLNLRRNGLEAVTLITLGHNIRAQAQGQILGMGHRRDAGHINGLHLLNHAENAGQLYECGPGFRIINSDPRQVRSTLHIVERQGHDRIEKPLKNRAV
jgi:hypothetical protein